MKKSLLITALLSASLAAQSVPEIAYDATDILKFPDTIHLGEAAGVATNSKGHIFVYTRTGAAAATVGSFANVLQGWIAPLRFDQTGKLQRPRDRRRHLRLQLCTAGPDRSAGQHLGRRSGIE